MQDTKVDHTKQNKLILMLSFEDHAKLDRNRLSIICIITQQTFIQIAT